MSMAKKDDFFDGFSWALPIAFAEPLAACRFEQGDVLYDSRRAYQGRWGAALPHIKYSLQVRLPLRGPVAKTEKEEESVFTDNWNQTVALAFTDYKEKETREITTTQGRLYSLLWRGEPALLEKDSAPPPVPTLAMQVLRDLPSTVVHLGMKILKGANKKIVFLMPYDRTRQLLRSKLGKIQGGLADFETKLDFVRPGEVGLTTDAEFAPTVSIACFSVQGASEAEVKEAIKRVLYVPSKDRKTAVERFRITAHGFLARI
jgi:hypothetical protein